MKNRFIALFLLLLSVAPTLLAQSERQRLEQERDDFRQALTTTGAVFSNVRRYFIDTVDLVKVNSYALNAMLRQLDPYTQYMDSETAKSFMEATDGAYAGIGAIISQKKNGGVIVNELMQGEPADQAGLKPGDWFQTIDGKSFVSATTPEVSEALRGKEGSDIEVVVLRKSASSPLTFRFKRRAISVSPIAYSGRLEGDIGILSLSSFTRDSGKELKKALQAMQEASPLKGLILDLRGNGGGVLQSAVEMLSLFVPKGTVVVSVKGRSQRSDASYRTTSEPLFPDIPLVVLINEELASASEIMAGALQDLDRAVVMGHKSFGKGLVQSTVPLPEGALLKLTTGQYFIPSGRNIQHTRLNPFSHNEESADDSDKSIEKRDSTIYYTQNGRKVYASNGITPDVVSTSDSLPSIIGFIAINSLLVDYIESYVASHEPPSSPIDFSLSDAAYQQFVKFLQEGGFSYQSGSSYLLEKLEEQLKRESKTPYVSNQLEELKKAVMPPLSVELERYKGEIKEFLENCLVLRYFYRKGFFARTLPKDSEVLQAHELLLTPKRYSELLAPPKEHASSE